MHQMIAVTYKCSSPYSIWYSLYTIHIYRLGYKKDKIISLLHIITCLKGCFIRVRETLGNSGCTVSTVSQS